MNFFSGLGQLGVVIVKITGIQVVGQKLAPVFRVSESSMLACSRKGPMPAETARAGELWPIDAVAGAGFIIDVIRALVDLKSGGQVDFSIPRTP